MKERLFWVPLSQLQVPNALLRSSVDATSSRQWDWAGATLSPMQQQPRRQAKQQIADATFLEPSHLPEAAIGSGDASHSLLGPAARQGSLDGSFPKRNSEPFLTSWGYNKSRAAVNAGSQPHNSGITTASCICYLH